MRLRLDRKKRGGKALREVMIGVARAARRDLLRIEEDPERCVHRFRTGMKKLRSLLRLVSGDLPRELKRAVIERVRYLKDALAGSRDEVVAAQTADRLLGKGAARRLRLKVPSHRGVTAAPPELVRAAGELLDLLPVMPIGRVGKKALKAAFRRTAKSGAKEWKRMAVSATNEEMHAWRRRVKDAWYQANVLRDLSTSIAKARKPARELSELLGEDHDLTMLEALSKGLTGADRARVAAERATGREKILALGKTLYGDILKAA
jgi:CHAD domain-containing protein